jgi:hypothetical protein
MPGLQLRQTQQSYLIERGAITLCGRKIDAEYGVARRYTGQVPAHDGQ